MPDACCCGGKEGAREDIAWSMERTAELGWAASSGGGGAGVACTVGVESSAAGRETTRDRPLTTLTVGIHEFKAALFRGEVARRWRGGLEDARLEDGLREVSNAEAAKAVAVAVVGAAGEGVTAVAFAERREVLLVLDGEMDVVLVVLVVLLVVLLLLLLLVVALEWWWLCA